MKISLPETKRHLNPVAQLYIQASQKTKSLIAGRGFSKSYTNGFSIAQKVEYLPGARGIFAGPTFTNMLTNTIMPMMNCWENLGYTEGIHYVIGKQPPDHFKIPYQPPKLYKNVISWVWGHAVIMGSMDRPDLLRGGSNDYFINDEALLTSKEVYGQIIVPTLRGSDIRLRGKPHHLNQEFTSSMPYGSLPGSWILDFQEKALDFPEDYFYIEGTSMDNVDILGIDTIKMWKRSMSKVQFDIECRNLRVKLHGSVFYPALKDHHWYPAMYNYDYIDSLDYNFDPTKGATVTAPDCRWDRDLDRKLPINISHDWGSFNTITIDQYNHDKNEVQFINEMNVVHPKIIDDLAREFVEYYQYHETKIVHQWGDKSGNKKEANAKETNFQQFADILEKAGWTVIKQKTGDIEHLHRHNFLNELHSEVNPNLPTVKHNMHKCKDLRIALENTPMKGIKKDKSSERNKSIKPEHATHTTDAYDYRLYHAFKNRSLYSRSKSNLGVRFGGAA